MNTLMRCGVVYRSRDDSARETTNMDNVPQILFFNGILSGVVWIVA